jgi:superfamily II DNA or RNA helicase
MIQGTKLDINKDIVIGMLQTVAKDKHSRDIYNDFGLVIFDEAHHAPSQYFSKALENPERPFLAILGGYVSYSDVFKLRA